MSDCSSNWKLPKQFPADAIQIADDKYRIRVGARKILLDRRQAECILADLQVLLKEVENK